MLNLIASPEARKGKEQKSGTQYQITLFSKSALFTQQTKSFLQNFIFDPFLSRKILTRDFVLFALGIHLKDFSQ